MIDAFNPETLVAIAPYARAEVKRWRFWWTLLGGLLFSLGVFAALLIGMAASPRDQPLLLAGIFVFVAILPGAGMLAYGLSHPANHPLVRALEGEPQRLKSVAYTYMQNIEGDYVDVARVELKTGASYVFAVPKALVRDRAPHLKRQSA